MKLAQFLREMDKDGRDRLAKAVGTSVAYLYQVASGHRTPSPGFAKKLEHATLGAVKRLELLYPDEYDEKPPKTA